MVHVYAFITSIHVLVAFYLTAKERHPKVSSGVFVASLLVYFAILFAVSRGVYEILHFINLM